MNKITLLLSTVLTLALVETAWNELGLCVKLLTIVTMTFVFWIVIDEETKKEF